MALISDHCTLGRGYLLIYLVIRSQTVCVYVIIYLVCCSSVYWRLCLTKIVSGDWRLWARWSRPFTFLTPMGRALVARFDTVAPLRRYFILLYTQKTTLMCTQKLDIHQLILIFLDRKYDELSNGYLFFRRNLTNVSSLPGKTRKLHFFICINRFPEFNQSLLDFFNIHTCLLYTSPSPRD